MFDDSDHIALDNSILHAFSQFRNSQTDHLSRHFFHLWNPVAAHLSRKSANHSRLLNSPVSASSADKPFYLFAILVSSLLLFNFSM